MQTRTEELTKQVYDRDASIRALAKGKPTKGMLYPSKYDNWPQKGVTPSDEFKTPTPSEVAQHLDDALSDKTSEKPRGKAERPKSALGITGRLALAAAGVTTIVGFGSKLLDSNPSQAPSESQPASPILSLTKTADAAKHLENGTYQVKIGDNDGTIYGAVETIAKAEGLNPQSTPVSESIANQANNIGALVAEGKVSSQSNGVVSGTGPNQTEFYVVPDKPIVDPAAFNAPAKENQEIITKAIS